MSVPAVFSNRLFATKSLAFTGTTLIIYDYLLTLPLEVEYIWNAPWTAVKAGFLLNRYGNLMGQSFIMLQETGYLNQGSTKFCAGFMLFCTLFMLFAGESIRILVLMRAWAVWGCTPCITVFLITLYVLYVLAMIGVAIYSQTIAIAIGVIPYLYLEQVDVCVQPIVPSVWPAWFATLGLDSIVLAMVWHSLRKLVNRSRGFCSSPLAHLLVRDAILFYATSLFNNVFAMVCWTAFSDDPRNFVLIGFSFPLLSIVGQRLILNLRGFDAGPVSMRDISWEVNRQIADIADRLWPDLDEEYYEADSDRGENGKTSRTTGMADTDVELAVIEVAGDESSLYPTNEGHV